MSKDKGLIQGLIKGNKNNYIDKEVLESKEELVVTEELNFSKNEEYSENMIYIEQYLKTIINKFDHIDTNIGSTRNDIYELSQNQVKQEKDYLTKIDTLDRYIKDISKELEKIKNRIDSKGTEDREKIIRDLQDSTKKQVNGSCENLREKIEIDKNNIIRSNRSNKEAIINILDEKLSETKSLIKKEVKAIDLNRDDEKISKYILKLEDNIESRFDKLEIAINNINSITEMLEGKIKQLNELSDIKELLTNLSNNQNKIDKKPINYEEEVIMNLGEYGSKIISELTDISSEYARNKEKIENISKIEEEHAIKLNESKKQYEQKGKISLVEEICEKFIDLDGLFEEKNNESTIIVGILKNNEFLKSEGLEKGTEIEINEENRVEMESKVSFSELGKYKIIKSAFELNGVIKYKAEVEKIQ